MLDPRRLYPEGTESRALAEVLALAFRDNPLNRAVIGGSEARRLRANRAGMRASLIAALPAAVVLIAPEGMDIQLEPETEYDADGQIASVSIAASGSTTDVSRT